MYRVYALYNGGKRVFIALFVICVTSMGMCGVRSSPYCGYNGCV